MMEVRLPELGEEIEKATISCLYVRVGDRINEGDDIVELATDKATFNVPATHSGVIKKILVKEGQEVKIGATLVLME